MGGSPPSQTIIQQPPAPSASESAADLYQARLQYDRPIAEQEQALRNEFYPQQASLEAALYNLYAPQIAEQQQQLQETYAPRQRALQESLFPQQTQLVEALSGQALQRLQSPFGYTGEEQTALDAIRGRQRSELQRQIRERANLGGGLYGGRAQSREEQALTELEQAFADQDINRRLQAGQQALQYATPALQIAYPQVQNPGLPQTQAPVSQSAVPSADALYNALYGASRQDVIQNQGSPSPLWGLGGQIAGGLATGLLLSSIQFKKNVRKWATHLN